MQLLSNNLKRLRNSCQLTQQQVANAIKVMKGTYDTWENRNIEPSIEKLIALSDFYGITVDELISEIMIDKKFSNFVATIITL